jgi:hypothetical protein
LQLTPFLPGKHTFYDRVFNSVACVAFVRKAADEIKIMTFFKSSGIKIMNDHVVVSNNLKKYFSVLVTSGLG